jgi:hypothetical protein
MTALFKLSGDYTTRPTSGSPSGSPAIASPILEQLALKNQTTGTICLDADGPVAVPLGALTNVHTFVIKTIGGKVTFRATSADGVQQAIPIDSFAAIISQSEPYTALEVERVAGVQTIVNFFLGERA